MTRLLPTMTRLPTTVNVMVGGFELALLVGMEHAVHGLNHLEALLMKSSRAAEGAAWKVGGGGGGASLASDSDDDVDAVPAPTCESDSKPDDDLDDELGGGSVSPALQDRSVGTSHAISADMKSAVQQAIAELKSAEFIDKPDCAFQLEVAVSELVDLWVSLPSYVQLLQDCPASPRGCR